MSRSDESRQIHFESPEYLFNRLDAIADFFETNRDDLLVEVIRDYIAETADDEMFQNRVGEAYYDDKIDFETVKQLVDTETAKRFRLLKTDFDDGQLTLEDPTDVDMYDENTTV